MENLNSGVPQNNKKGELKMTPEELEDFKMLSLEAREKQIVQFVMNKSIELFGKVPGEKIAETAYKMADEYFPVSPGTALQLFSPQEVKIDFNKAPPKVVPETKIEKSDSKKGKWKNSAEAYAEWEAEQEELQAKREKLQKKDNEPLH